MLVAVLLAGAAWRLAQGPVDLSWLTARLEAAVNTPDSPLRLHIGDTALAWEGFRFGVDRPLDLRLTDIRVTDRTGQQRAVLPQAELSLSLGALLAGHLRPRAIGLDRPSLVFRRAPDGTIRLDLGGLADSGGDRMESPLPTVLAELARPPATDRSAMRGWLSQIRRVRIHDATVTVEDRKLGVTWGAPQAEIDLTRNPAGGVQGAADLSLALADEHARLQVTATLSAAATETRLTARLSPVTPAALARIVPRLAPLAALDAPVGVVASLLLGPELEFRRGQVALNAGAGRLRIADGVVPVEAASAIATLTPDRVQIESVRAALPGHADGTPTLLNAAGAIWRNGNGFAAGLSLDLDDVAFAQLPYLWPAGLAAGARRWITRNITAGTAHDGHVVLALTANEDFSAVNVTRAGGTLDGDGLTVRWHDQVPPIEDGHARLRILDPDRLEIAVSGGRERTRGGGALSIAAGSMRITGLTHPDQTGTIQAEIHGTLPDALALLREPALHLLDAHPMRLDNPAGQVVASLSVTLPLDVDVRIDDVAIQASAHLEHVHLDGVVAGRSLDDGRLDLTATNNGLTLKGEAALAGMAARLDASMDFRAGPVAGVVQRIAVSGTPDARQLARAGLDATDLLSGPVPLDAVLTERRDGSAALAVHADLTPSVLSVAPLAWSKPAGRPAEAKATLRLEHDRLAGIDGIVLSGDGLSVRGSVATANGKLSLVRLDRVVLGGSDVQGSVRLPAAPGAPIAVTLRGPVLDLSAWLERPHQPTPRQIGEPPPGPPWTLEARFDRVVMAHRYLLQPLTVEADNDGRVFRRLHVAGETRDHGPFELRITPEGRGRRLVATAAQTGDLLRALDWLDGMQQGHLAITATYDDTQPGHPLSGTAELSDFRVREAATLGKLLQAMTLYGLVDALRGPGLSFNSAILPFRLTDQTLELSGARAFSSSLGLTAKGQIDFDARRVDMQGTIVPAYFFNSLLGHVPLVGKLLSPEQGGGVFAASYTLRGKLDDPDVFVNPLTALTPGILRGLFGAF